MFTFLKSGVQPSVVCSLCDGNVRDRCFCEHSSLDVLESWQLRIVDGELHCGAQSSSTALARLMATSPGTGTAK